MTTTLKLAEQLVADLAATGLRITLDPAALIPPGALLGPPEVMPLTYCAFTYTWTLTLCGAQPGFAAWASLDDQLALVLPVLQGWQSCIPATTLVNGVELPCYQIKFERGSS